MRYLIDTNVLSETFKRAPDRKIVRWLTEQSPLYLRLWCRACILARS